ncbi:MAG: zf-TFIIB domain-containing protein [Syntrophobacteraceae bacterium]
MQCPICQVDLVIADRQGIEIDYCPKCRGVWLDRGELDKVIERSASPSPANYAAEQRGGYHQPAPHPHQGHQNYQNHHGNYNNHPHQGHYKRKRKSFLEDIFDFD